MSSLAPGDADFPLIPVTNEESEVVLPLFPITGEATDSPTGSALLDSFLSHDPKDNRITLFDDLSESQFERPPAGSSDPNLTRSIRHNTDANSTRASRRAVQTAKFYAINRLNKVLRSDRDNIAATKGDPIFKGSPIVEADPIVKGDPIFKGDPTVEADPILKQTKTTAP